MWKIGANTSSVSSEQTSTVYISPTWFHQKLPCVSIAPLGRPVVPEVYMTTATSSLDGAAGGRCNRPASAMASNSRGHRALSATSPSAQ